MHKGQNKLKIGTRLCITTGLLFILTCTAIVALVNYSMRRQALVEAEEKIKILSDQYIAIHSYFTHQLKPALFEFTRPMRSKEYFDPTWMSSTYAVREINKDIRNQGGGEYSIKDAAINARSPENEATPFEREFISALNNDPTLQHKSGIQIFDGHPYFVVLRRGELMEESCLRCHSSPTKAPGNLVHQYGPERSFNRKTGDIVSAISIRVPLSSAYAEANRFSLKLSAMMLALLFFLFGVSFWIVNRSFFMPLSRIHQKALEISSSQERLGELIPLPPGRELRELTATFNAMSTGLRYHLDNLERLVHERTAELEKVNNQLELDLIDRKRMEEILHRMSFLDGLTGIANRRYFDEQYQKEWKRAVRESLPLSLVMIDIDFFKSYNDAYGHLFGDDCLKKVAETIQSCVKRPGDIVARYGGEEFMVMFPSTNSDGAARLAEMIRRAIADLRIQNSRSVAGEYLTVSLGIASVIPQHMVSPDTLIDAADKALYLAKENGRNRVEEA